MAKLEVTLQKTSHGKAPHYPYARIVCIREKGKEHCGVDSNTMGYKSFYGSGFKKKAKAFFNLAKKIPPHWKKKRKYPVPSLPSVQEEMDMVEVSEGRMEE